MPWARRSTSSSKDSLKTTELSYCDRYVLTTDKMIIVDQHSRRVVAIKGEAWAFWGTYRTVCLVPSAELRETFEQVVAPDLGTKYLLGRSHSTNQRRCAMLRQRLARRSVDAGQRRTSGRPS